MSVFDRVPRFLDKSEVYLRQLPGHIARCGVYFRQNSPRRLASLALMIVGIALLGYVGSQYWAMYRSQQNLEAAWDRQAAGVMIPGRPDTSSDPILTRVIIPKIKMDAIVV